MGACSFPALGCPTTVGSSLNKVALRTLENRSGCLRSSPFLTHPGSIGACVADAYGEAPALGTSRRCIGARSDDSWTEEAASAAGDRSIRESIHRECTDVRWARGLPGSHRSESGSAWGRAGLGVAYQPLVSSCPKLHRNGEESEASAVLQRVGTSRSRGYACEVGVASEICDDMLAS